MEILVRHVYLLLIAALQEDGSRKIFSAPFCSILKTISFCCCEDNDKASLHQTELLHMLSAYVRKKPGVRPHFPDITLCDI